MRAARIRRYTLAGQRLLRFARPANRIGLRAVAASAAIGARYVHIRKKLHVKRHLTRTIARGATQLAGVVGERAGLQARRLRRLGTRKRAAQVVKHAGVRRHRRAHVRPDGRSVHQLHARNAVSCDAAHGAGKRLTCNHRGQRRNQLLKHHGGLAASRHTGNRYQPVHRQVNHQRMHRVQRVRFHMDGPSRK